MSSQPDLPRDVCGNYLSRFRCDNENSAFWRNTVAMRYRRSGGFGQLSIRDQISIFGRAGQSPYLSCSWGHGRREFRHSEPAPKVRHVSRTESKKLVQETTPSFSVPASCTQEVAKGRIAWLCSRNDLTNSSSVLIAAALAALVGRRWPVWLVPVSYS